MSGSDAWFAYRTRLSFPDESRTLLETGRAMAEFAERIARRVAPELEWEVVVAEHADFGQPARWEASHVVALVGRFEGEERARGESRLTAGGRGHQIGATGRIVIESVRPIRQIQIDNHSDVANWDVVAGPLSHAQILGLREDLEAVLGAEAEAAGERRERLERGAQVLAVDATAEDAALWLEDLNAVGVTARAKVGDDGHTVIVEHADLPDLEALAAARITLGEILAEAGEDDWDERTCALLMALTEVTS